MQILKLCRFGKACKRNLIKLRETKIQRHIENPIKHKIELLWKNKIASTLFKNITPTQMLQRTLKMPSETDKICPYKAGFPIVGCRVFQIALKGGKGGNPPPPPTGGGTRNFAAGVEGIWARNFFRSFEALMTMLWWCSTLTRK